MPRKRERKVKSWSLGHPVLRCLWDAPVDVPAKKSELEGSLWSEEGYSRNVPKGGREKLKLRCSQRTQRWIPQRHGSKAGEACTIGRGGGVKAANLLFAQTHGGKSLPPNWDVT